MPVPPRILVLEDSVLVAMELEAALAERGLAVVCAGSIAAARLHIGGAPFDAALLDLFLPDGDCTAIAGALHAAGCAVAIVSGADHAAGTPPLAFAKRFRKPVSADKLVQWVESRVIAGNPAA